MASLRSPLRLVVVVCGEFQTCGRILHDLIFKWVDFYYKLISHQAILVIIQLYLSRCVLFSFHHFIYFSFQFPGGGPGGMPGLPGSPVSAMQQRLDLSSVTMAQSLSLSDQHRHLMTLAGAGNSAAAAAAVAASAAGAGGLAGPHGPPPGPNPEKIGMTNVSFDFFIFV